MFHFQNFKLKISEINFKIFRFIQKKSGQIWSVNPWCLLQKCSIEKKLRFWREIAILCKNSGKLWKILNKRETFRRFIFQTPKLYIKFLNLPDPKIRVFWRDIAILWTFLEIFGNSEKKETFWRFIFSSSKIIHKISEFTWPKKDKIESHIYLI